MSNSERDGSHVMAAENSQLDPRDIAAAADLAANAPPLPVKARDLLLALYANSPSSPTTAA